MADEIQVAIRLLDHPAATPTEVYAFTVAESDIVRSEELTAFLHSHGISEYFFVESLHITNWGASHIGQAYVISLGASATVEVIKGLISLFRSRAQYHNFGSRVQSAEEILTQHFAPSGAIVCDEVVATDDGRTHMRFHDKLSTHKIVQEPNGNFVHFRRTPKSAHAEPASLAKKGKRRQSKRKSRRS